MNLERTPIEPPMRPQAAPQAGVQSGAARPQPSPPSKMKSNTQAHAQANTPTVFDQRAARHKRGRFWKVFGLLALISIGGGAGAAVFTETGRAMFPALIKTGGDYIAVRQNPDLLFHNVNSDRVNILLIGEDRNWTTDMVLNPRTGKKAKMKVLDEDSPPRSDTLILASLDRVGNTISMVSLPRDARVRFRDLDGVRHRGKLNSVYAEGGSNRNQRIATLKNFLRNEMGVRVDRTVVLKLDAFDQIVNSVGGVNVDVEGALKRNGSRGRMAYEDSWGGWKIDLEPGMQHLDGEEAHGYVRFRTDIEGDPGRIRRQQQVMQAVAKRLMENKLQLPMRAVELKKQFITDLTDQELLSAALFAKEMPGGVKISPLTTYGVYAENGDVILNKPDNIKLFTAVFGSSFNPDDFLSGSLWRSRSLWTRKDEIGQRNNSKPEALSVLRKAGLVEEEEAVEATTEESRQARR